MLDYDCENVEGMSPDFGGRGFLTPREKSDLEMGSMHEEDMNTPVSENLQDFDFNHYQLTFPIEGQYSYDPFFGLEIENTKDSARTSAAAVLNFDSNIAKDEVEESTQSCQDGDGVKESTQRPIDINRTNATKETDDKER